MEITDQPGEPGVYVAWVNPSMPVPYAERRLLMWHDSQWSFLGSDQKFRGHVYQCLGPLPALKLES